VVKSEAKAAPELVRVTMTVALVVEGLRSLFVGQVLEVPRAQACRWWLMDWARPEAEFSLEERIAGGRAALEEREAQARNRGADGFWGMPVHARWLVRLEQLTRPDAGPQEAA
jgi:hypothetical protein